MRKKLFGMFICVMLMTTFFTVTLPAEKKDETSTHMAPIPLASPVDVPVWEIGDKWTYKIDNITLDINQNNQTIFLYLTIAQLPLEVIASNTTCYTLSFETSVSGHSKIYGDFGNGLININITFSNLAISGNITIEKSTLGIKALDLLFNGRFWVDIIQQPYISFSLPVLPVRLTINATMDLDFPFCLLTFPLDTNMSWNSTPANLTLNGMIQSPWLHLILFINNIASLLGYELLPPEIAALLPVVNIKDALTAMGYGNMIQIPAIPDVFYCLTTEDVTVPAGTYNTYNITLLGGLGFAYYAPTAGTIVKISGNFEEIIPYLTSINMELLSTNYS
jgi:hypothetical protein